MSGDIAAEGTRTCPFCAETIKAAAIKCRFCGSDLTGAEQKIQSTQHRMVDGKCVKCGCSEAYIKKFSPTCKTLQASEVEAAVSRAKSRNTVKCPKCLSESVSANKSGFGLGKAAAGGILLGGVGLLGGFVGSRKIYLTCMKCGHKWHPNA